MVITGKYFSLLSKFLPQCSEAYDEVELNRRRWQVVKNEVGDKPIMVKGKLDIRHLDVDQLLNDKEGSPGTNSPDTQNSSSPASPSKQQQEPSPSEINDVTAVNKPASNCVSNSTH